MPSSASTRARRGVPGSQLKPQRHCDPGGCCWRSRSITLLKLKFSVAEYTRPLVAELWFYPDGSRILELSTKCPPSQAFQTAAEGRMLLTGRGVDLTGEQQTKTKTALQYFAKQLASAAS